MDIRQLHYFLTLCEEMNYTRAAQRLFLSRQALRQSISALEAEMCGPLFISAHHKLALTDRGMSLQRHAAPVVEQFQQMQAALRAEIQSAQPVRIGISVALVPDYLPGLETQLDKFRQQYPHVEMRFRLLDNDAVADGVEQGELDAGLVIDLGCAAPVLARTTLRADPACLLVPRGHPFWEKERIPLAELRGQRVLLPSLRQDLFSPLWAACARAGFAPNAEIGPSFYQAYYLVQEQLCTCLTRYEPGARRELDRVRDVLLEDMPPLCVSLVQRRDTSSAYIDLLRSYLLEVLGSTASLPPRRGRPAKPFYTAPVLSSAAAKAAPEHPAPGTQLPFAGGNNFRELGGYHADEGKTVKWGQIYRGFPTGRLTTEADRARLDGLGLRLILDLRSGAEAAKLPDYVPDGARLVQICGLRDLGVADHILKVLHIPGALLAQLHHGGHDFFIAAHLGLYLGLAVDQGNDGAHAHQLAHDGCCGRDAAALFHLPQAVRPQHNLHAVHLLFKFVDDVADLCAVLQLACHLAQIPAEHHRISVRVQQVDVQMVLRALLPQHTLCHQGVVVGGGTGLVDGHMNDIGVALVHILAVFFTELDGRDGGGRGHALCRAHLIVEFGVGAVHTLNIVHIIQQDVETHNINAVLFGHLLRDIAGGISQDRDLAHNFPHFHS